MIAIADAMVMAFLSSNCAETQYTMAAVTRGPGNRLRGEFAFGIQDPEETGVLEAYGKMWQAITMAPGFVGAIQFMVGSTASESTPGESHDAIMIVIEDASGWCRTRLHPFMRDADGKITQTAPPDERDGDRSDTRGLTLGRWP
jgi:hypothetical protein